MSCVSCVLCLCLPLISIISKNNRTIYEALFSRIKKNRIIIIYQGLYNHQYKSCEQVMHAISNVITLILLIHLGPCLCIEHAFPRALHHYEHTR